MPKRYLIATFSGTKKQLDLCLEIERLKELNNQLCKNILTDINGYDCHITEPS
jgi:hypothetical protein